MICVIDLPRGVMLATDERLQFSADADLVLTPRGQLCEAFSRTVDRRLLDVRDREHIRTEASSSKGPDMHVHRSFCRRTGGASVRYQKLPNQTAARCVHAAMCQKCRELLVRSQAVKAQR